MKVPFINPKLPEPDELVEDLKRIYKNNYYSNNGPVYFEFKKSLEEYFNQNGLHAVIVSNATLALMMAIHAIFGEPKNGKRFVAIPSFTFAAGPLAIKWCGYEPVFFDIGEQTLQPSIDSFKEVLDNYGDRLAGLLLTNNFGIGNSNIDEWESLLSDVGIPMMIDSAPGLGSTYTDGKLIGGRGDSEIFSLHATKPFGIGEGGLITTRNESLAKRYELLKNFGFDEQKQTVDLGFNAKITELDCAIGLRILSHYDDILSDRRKSYLYYKNKLKKHDVSFLPRAETASIQFATILVSPEKRPKVLGALSSGGVEARTYYAPAVHEFPMFKHDHKVSLGATEVVSKKVVSLPVHPNMSERTIDYICDIIAKEL